MSIFSNNRLLTTATIALLLVNVFTLAMLWKQKKSAPIESRDTNQPPPRIFEVVTKELGLDSTQQEIYKTLRAEHSQGARQLQENVKQAKDSFYALLQSDFKTDEDVQKANDKVAKAIATLEMYNFKHFEKVRAICKAEQKIKFDVIIKEVLNRMSNGRRPPPPNNEDRDNRPPPPNEDYGERPPPPDRNDMPPPDELKKH
jgi:periplasmic protein CpxP/Spy